MFTHLKEVLTAAVKTGQEYILCRFVSGIFTDINIVSKVNVCV